MWLCILLLMHFSSFINSRTWNNKSSQLSYDSKAIYSFPTWTFCWVVLFLREHCKKTVTFSRFWLLGDGGESIKKGQFVTKIFFRQGWMKFWKVTKKDIWCKSWCKTTRNKRPGHDYTKCPNLEMEPKYLMKTIAQLNPEISRTK